MVPIKLLLSIWNDLHTQGIWVGVGVGVGTNKQETQLCEFEEKKILLSNQYFK